MSKIQTPKKLRAEDFAADDRDLVSKIAFIFNDLADSFYFALNKSLDENNLNQDIVSVIVNIDGTGAVSNLPLVKYNLRNKPRGILCIRAVNVNSPNTYPTQAPFVSWDVGSAASTVQILAVSGLQNNSQYSLTLQIIG